MRSLFWKIFIFLWLANLVLLIGGYTLVRLDYQSQYQKVSESERLKGMTEYLVSRYEAGMDTRDFRPRIPIQNRVRFSIVDMDTGLTLFGRPDIDLLDDEDRKLEYTSPSGRQYRIYVAEFLYDGLKPTPTPMLHVAWAMVITAAFSWLLSWLITRPLRQLKTRVEAVGEGELNSDLRNELIERKDVFGELAMAVENMAARIHELIESRQRLYYDVSHELRAPLARMQAALGVLRVRGEPDQRTGEMYDRLEKEVESLGGLVSEMVDFRNDSKTHYPIEKVDLIGLLQSVVDDQLFEKNIARIQMPLDQKLTIKTKPVLLSRAIKNILENALKYSDESEPVVVRIDPKDSCILLSIEDSGSGIPEDKLQQVLQPFTRLHSESVEGVGLGLSIVRRAAIEINAQLTISNRAERGLLVELRLPV